MTLELRKLVCHTEEVFIEGGKAAETPRGVSSRS